jgi:membrane protease YdiL (CAAX protease family)
MTSEALPSKRLVQFGVLFEGGLGVAAWLLGWLLKQPPLKDFRWDAGAAALGVAASLPMLLLFLLCIRWPVGPLARIRRITDEVIRPLFASCTLFELALLSLMAGVGEEMLFRGFLQRAFMQWWGVWAGVAVASVLFGLVHCITPTYAVLATLIGVYLGAWWLATGNLLVVIVAHGLYDFVALVYLLRGTVPRSVNPSPEARADAPSPPATGQTSFRTGKADPPSPPATG